MNGMGITQTLKNRVLAMGLVNNLGLHKAYKKLDIYFLKKITFMS